MLRASINQRAMRRRHDSSRSAPANPYLVLAAAIFPGCGHVMLGVASRGLQFVFFMVILRG